MLQQSILLLGAHLNWGSFKYYCMGHISIGWKNQIGRARAPGSTLLLGPYLNWVPFKWASWINIIVNYTIVPYACTVVREDANRN